MIAESIATERLRLDPLAVGDADDMSVVYADRRMYEFTGGEPPSLDALARRYRALVAGRSPDGTEWWLNWVVRVDGDPHAIGAVQSTVSNGSARASVAWEIGVPWQGQGYAGEAAVALVDWLVNRSVGTIEAFVHPEHAASQAVARRAGLQPTGEILDGEERWQLP